MLVASETALVSGSGGSEEMFMHVRRPASPLAGLVNGPLHRPTRWTNQASRLNTTLSTMQVVRGK